MTGTPYAQRAEGHCGDKVTRLSEEEKGKVSDLLFEDPNSPPQASFPPEKDEASVRKEAACRMVHDVSVSIRELQKR